MKVVKGDRFQVTKKMAVRGLVAWHAPMTTGFDGFLEKGEIVICVHTSPGGATAFQALPKKKEEFEKRYIAESRQPKYQGYALVLKAALVGNGLKQIASEPPKPLSLDDVRMETCTHLSFEQDLPHEVKGTTYQPWCLLQRDTKGDAGTKLTLRIKRAAEKVGLKTRSNKCPFMVNEALTTCPCFETKVVN